MRGKEDFPERRKSERRVSIRAEGSNERMIVIREG